MPFPSHLLQPRGASSSLRLGVSGCLRVVALPVTLTFQTTDFVVVPGQSIPHNPKQSKEAVIVLLTCC